MANSPIIYGSPGAIDLQNSLTFSSGLGPTIYAPATPVNPSVTATLGNPGDIYVNNSTAQVFVKQDSGSTTNWSPLAITVSSNVDGGTASSVYTIAQVINGGTP